MSVLRSHGMGRWPKLAPRLLHASSLIWLSAGPAAADQSVGLSIGKMSLPSSWIAEALMVSFALALPAMIAGVTIGLGRAFRRPVERGAYRPRF